MQDYTNSPHKREAGVWVPRPETGNSLDKNNIHLNQKKYNFLLDTFPEQGRNQHLMTHIHNALNLGISYEVIRRDLIDLPQISNPHDPITEEEIDRAVARVKETRKNHEFIPRGGITPEFIVTGTKQVTEKRQECSSATFDALKSRSPYPLTGEKKDAEMFLKSLFHDDECVCIGGVKSNHPCQIRSFLGRLDDLGEYITINPFTTGATRSDKNVAAYRHMLVEFDIEDKEKASNNPMFLRQELEKQAGFWNDMLDKGMPIISLTYSGSKSIHALFRVDIPNEAAWKQEIEGKIYPIFCRMGADPANKNPSRFSRMPMSMRGDVQQELLYLNPKVAPMKPEELFKRLQGLIQEVELPTTEASLYELIPAICESKMTEVEKERAIYEATINQLKKQGTFYNVKVGHDSVDLLYLKSSTHIVRSIKNKQFRAELAEQLGLAMSDKKYIHTFERLESGLLASGDIQVVRPRKYWHSIGDAIYISCNDHEMVRITSGSIEVVANGTDQVIFQPEAVLEDWTYVEENYGFWKNQLWRDSTIKTNEEKYIAFAWTTLLPFSQGNKPILCVTGGAGSGKTKISKGAIWLWGVPDISIQPLQDENKGMDNFGIGVDHGGIVLMDNVDTVYKWLPDALAKYSTGEIIRKRKLYSDKEQVELRGDAALVINSVKPYFASDPGCNARLLVVRMNSREGKEERDKDSELKEDILQHRDAALSSICRLLQKVLADKVPVKVNLGLRHNDWGELAVKLGRALRKESFATTALLKNQDNQADIVLENNALATTIESYFSQSNQELTGYTDAIKNTLSNLNPDYNMYCSIQKFTAIFQKNLPYLKRIYHVKELTIGRVNRTQYRISPRTPEHQ